MSILVVWSLYFSQTRWKTWGMEVFTSMRLGNSSMYRIFFFEILKKYSKADSTVLKVGVYPFERAFAKSDATSFSSLGTARIFAQSLAFKNSSMSLLFPMRLRPLMITISELSVE